jgi:hypothetical protein
MFDTQPSKFISFFTVTPAPIRARRSTTRSAPVLQSKPGLRRRAAGIISFVALSFIATNSVSSWTASSNDDAEIISSLVTSEETALMLRSKMNALSQSVLDRQLPGTNAAAIFAPAVLVSDLAPQPILKTNAPGDYDANPWPVEPSARKIAKVDLWRPLFDSVASLEHAKFSLTSGEYPAGDVKRYESGAAFEALARLKTGEWCSLEGKVKIGWERAAAGGTGEDWRIVSWITEELNFITQPKRLFSEVLDTALRHSEDLALARHSGHYDATVKYYRDGMKKLPHPYFAPISVNQKEGIAIVDLDQDGYDDIYVTVRIGKNMFFRNRGDGTFTEEASLHNLDLPGHTTCAIFADFDNDGDIDVMLGRSLLKTTYLENRGGWFYQRPIPSFMPMAVISMSAADYNGDGLLDIYLCTYRPAAPSGASPAGGVAQSKDGEFDWPDEFFSKDMAREFRRRLVEHKQQHGITVLDQIGPPNVLLINRGGGRFEIAPENKTVGVWRNSLQATWCDYNEDGRPDLFIANDWGPDNLFRNDGTNGFMEVTKEAGITEYGFAMGASWGDYDNDGREDIYVSNMYSEPGRRITGRIPGLNPMFIQSATGNWLYHQEPDGKFKQVAGLKAPAMTVMNAGWSWGGCFADFDNDSFLDLYVLNGYFTAPKDFSSGVDLESNLWRTMVRSDENLARASFRFSPEWKRTRDAYNVGPEIDARLAGVERRGDKILVHSLNGSERNRFFENQKGRSFADISAISGLDNVADSRGFAVLDYDRDGWQDIVLVNANTPLMNLYHNDMRAAGISGGMIAFKFVGGTHASSPGKGFACRDGYGARITVNLDNQKLLREHRCGDGWSTQNSATMIVGIGAHTNATSIQVRWPSGKITSANNIPEGTLVTCYENPSDSPSGEPIVRAKYRVKPAHPG